VKFMAPADLWLAQDRQEHQGNPTKGHSWVGLTSIWEWVYAP